MKVKNKVLCGLMFFPLLYGYLEIPEQIKTPSEVASSIKEFLKNQELPNGETALDDDQHVALMEQSQKAKQLLIDGYVINHMCQVSLESNKALIAWIEGGQQEIPEEVNGVRHLIRMYQENMGQEVDFELFKVMEADCLCNCKKIKGKLNERIPALYKRYDAMRQLLGKR